MKINLRVTYNDKSVQEVTTTARDIIAFEDKFDKSITSLSTDLYITDMLWLAWHWLERKGKTTLSFEDWSDEIDDVAEGEESPK